MATRKEAENLIAKLRKSNGAISEKTRKWLEENSPEDLDAIKNVRRKLGASTRTLATNLYSKDTRFIYELVQNADDNSYSRATSNGVNPFLCFMLHDDEIIIDSNEDGFQPRDVEAICSTGESTKKSSGYIGEKGIGFKSVFKVARKVHIQSGHFSFAFEYDNESDDDGLGMVTPISEPFVALPDGVTTRTTLTLLESCSAADRAKELRALPETLLLFLKKLRRLELYIYQSDEGLESIKYERIGNSLQDSERIDKQVILPSGKNELTSKRFLVVRKMIRDLPVDQARKNISTAEVVLAFPVDATDTPVLEPQQTFAFLPLRPVGFKFLIQSDFITQASREDVFHSARNRALLNGAALTFCIAVRRFVEHETLQYQWMRYLPDENVTDEFWSGFRPNLQTLLQATPILRSRGHRELYLPNQLKYVAQDFRGFNGKPLFKDLYPELYLADEYKWPDFQKLNFLGSRRLSAKDKIKRLEKDLQLSVGRSRMKKTTSDDWHARVARAFAKCFESNDRNANKLRSLAMIPLIDGSWVSASETQVYFPSSGECDIPEDIGFSLVNPVVLSNEPRKSLFELLGVEHCVPESVIDAIYKKHQQRLFDFTSMALAYAHHMRYLYCYLPEDVKKLDDAMTVLAVKDGRSAQVNVHDEENVYFNEPDDELGAVQLFRPGATTDIGLPSPGLSVWILDQSYNDAPPLRQHGPPWHQWLMEFTRIRKIPPYSEDSQTLSDELYYLADYRPSTLFELLREKQEYYAAASDGFEDILKKRSVRPCNGTGLVQIDGAYYPSHELIDIACKFGLEKEIFLPISSKHNNSSEAAWSFLNSFGVRFSDDLDFYLKALQKLSTERPVTSKLNIVLAIYAGVRKNVITEAECSNLRSLLKNNKVYLPSRGSKLAKWVSINDCRWSGPEWLQSIPCLASYREYSDFSHFFKVNLRVKDTSHHDYLHELDNMKQQGNRDVAKVSKIYKALHRQFEKDQSSTWLREEFESRSLVLVPLLGVWFPPSKCVWADERSTLFEKASISTSFSKLESFFCTMLQISKPSVKIRVANLKEVAKKQDATLIKQELMAIASMNPSPEDLETLRKTNMYPVRIDDGDTKMTNAECDWVIVDRNEYAAAFQGQPICTLNYSMDEVLRIRRVLEVMNLNTRFMSAAVEETTMVDDGTLNSKMTDSMRRKAFALYRCARHFKSSRSDSEDSNLFELLDTLEVYESDQISKSMRLSQSGETFTVRGSRSNIHLEEQDGILKLYIPANKRNQEVCCFQQLPREILKFLEVSDKTAEAVLKGIVGASSLAVVEDILADEGIIEVEGIERPSTPDSLERSVVLQSNDTSPASSETWVPLSRPSPLQRQRQQMSPGTSVLEDDPLPRSTLSTNQVSSITYATILEDLVKISEIFRLPASSDAKESNVLPDRTHRFSRVHFPSQVDRDMSVGAAGEMLVFEILQNYDFSNFGIENWQSCIRNRVNVHERYSGLAPWPAQETTDFVYQDVSSKLTEELVGLGYFNEDDVAVAPKYYLEVKTTTGHCDDEFYMSNNQYRMMQRLKMVPGTRAAEIMIILRVFQVDRESVGLKLFVDPEAHRRDGTLSFGSDKWCVRPVS